MSALLLVAYSLESSAGSSMSSSVVRVSSRVECSSRLSFVACRTLRFWQLWKRSGRLCSVDGAGCRSAVFLVVGKCMPHLLSDLYL